MGGASAPAVTIRPMEAIVAFLHTLTGTYRGVPVVAAQ